MLRITLITLLLTIHSINAISQPSREDINRARNLFNEGVEYGLSKSFDKALEAFNAAIEINPIYTKAFLYRGLTKTELSDYDGAIKDFTITIELDPGYSDQAHYFRGVAKYGQKNYHGSIQDLSVAIRLSPDFISFYHRGKAYLKINQYGRALQDFDISYRLNPDFEEIHFHRGVALYHVGQHQSAVQDLDIATQIMSDNPEAFYYAGLAKIEIQNSYAAIEDLDKCINLDPNFYQAYQARAQAMKNIGNHQAADDDLEKARIIASKKAEQQKADQTIKVEKTPSETLNIAQFFSSDKRAAEKKPTELSDIKEKKSIKEESEIPTELTVKSEKDAKPAVASIKTTKNLAELSSGFYNKVLEESTPKGFGIQVASYSSIENLQNLANAYEEQFGQPVFINITYINDRRMYRIIIGEFNNRTNAESFRDNLRANNFSDCFLVVFERLY